MAADDTPFLSRWSRRKVLVREGVPVVDEAPVVTVEPPRPPEVAAVLPAPTATPPADIDVAAPAAPPPPTLDDVAALTTQSDYTRFVAQGVTPEVKNAALKKLFTDPHFNVMDGLDTYVDDYSKPDPLPAGMLRQMVQSKLLGLFDDEDKDLPAAVAAALPAQAPTPADSVTATATATDTDTDTEPVTELPTDEDLALQLQPDPAAGRAGLAPGAGENAGRQH